MTAQSRRAAVLCSPATLTGPPSGVSTNTGVQDAHNLAWKLAWVETGWADAGLLDTYDA
jgi:2-polyprenyl-6-methoxyphenol hydroxylase-like FAD-dependent oxidoreductase